MFVLSNYTCNLTWVGTFSVFKEYTYFLLQVLPCPQHVSVCVYLYLPAYLAAISHQPHCCGAPPCRWEAGTVPVFHHCLHGSCTCKQECRVNIFYFFSARYKPAGGLVAHVLQLLLLAHLVVLVFRLERVLLPEVPDPIQVILLLLKGATGLNCPGKGWG